MEALTALLLVLLASPAAPEDRLEPSGPPAPPGRRGVTVAGHLFLDVVAGRHGGRRAGEGALGWAVLSATLDTEALELWDAGELHVSVQGTFGRQPSSFVGDVQVTSNIEAAPTVRFYEAWYEHRWRSGRQRLLAGLRDYNSDFDVLESAAVFLNSSFGLQPEIAQAGPPTFPDTTAGVRFHSDLGHGTWLRAGVYRGGPPAYGTTRSTGRWSALELGWRGGRSTAGHRPRAALGAWSRDGGLIDDSGVERDTVDGVYLIAERPWPLSRGPFRLLEAFLQLGSARGGGHRIEEYAGAGVTASTRTTRHEGIVVGLAVAHARNGDRFLSLNPGIRRAETVVEATARIPLGRMLAFQPDLQWVRHPGALPARGSALVAAVRLHASF